MSSNQTTTPLHMETPISSQFESSSAQFGNSAIYIILVIILVVIIISNIMIYYSCRNTCQQSYKNFY